MEIIEGLAMWQAETPEITDFMKEIIDHNNAILEEFKMNLKDSLPEDVIEIFRKFKIADVTQFYRNKARRTVNPNHTTRQDFERRLLQSLTKVLETSLCPKIPFHMEFVEFMIRTFEIEVRHNAAIENTLHIHDEPLAKQRQEFAHTLSDIETYRQIVLNKLSSTEKKFEDALQKSKEVINSTLETGEKKKKNLADHVNLCELRHKEITLEIKKIALKIKQSEPNNFQEMEIALEGSSKSDRPSYTDIEFEFNGGRQLLKNWIEEQLKNKKYASSVTVEAAKLLHKDLQSYSTAFHELLVKHSSNAEKLYKYVESINNRSREVLHQVGTVPTNIVVVQDSWSLLVECENDVDNLSLYAAIHWLKE